MGRESAADRRKRLAAMRERMEAKYPGQITAAELDSAIVAADTRRATGRPALASSSGPERPISLPEITAATPGHVDLLDQRAASAMDAAPTKRLKPKIAKSTARRFEQAEAMLRRQVRDQWRDVNRSFRQYDKAGGIVTDLQLKEVLYRNNIVIEDKHMDSLLYKIDEDGDGKISYREFLKYFGKGTAEDRNINSQVQNVSVDEAVRLIRAKVEQRLETGPSGLRRAFQFFDSDGSGLISHSEFRDELRRRCGLEFRPETLALVMRRFDDDGTGIDYRKFAQLVMGSKASDGSSFLNPNLAAASGGDDAGTSDQMTRRKIRDQWRELGMAFRIADRGKTGFVTETQLLDICKNHQVDFSALRRQELTARLTRDPSDKSRVSYKSFMKLWGKGSNEDRNVITCVRGISKEQLKQMIRDKIQQRLKGGPGGLRRAFQFFDGDGGGSISFEELRGALSTLVGLKFDEPVLREAFADFAEGEPEIDFKKFSHHVMGSKPEDMTSFDIRQSNKNLRKTSSKIDGNSQMQVRRQVRVKARQLQIAFRHADTEEAGEIPVDTIKRIMEEHDIDVPDDDWKLLVHRMKPQSNGMVDYDRFFAMFKVGQDDEKLDASIGTVKGLSVDQAMELIRDKIRGRLPSGPSELRRTFQFFDTDGSGSISLGEFREALQLKCGLKFEPSLLKQIMTKLDTDGIGSLNFHTFSQFVLGSCTQDSTTFGQHLEPQEAEGEQFIRRKVRKSWKRLRQDFTRAGNGTLLSTAQFKRIINLYEIRPTKKQLGEWLSRMGHPDASDEVDFTAFMKLFAKGSEFDRQVVTTIKGVSAEQAITMIQDKVRGRLSSGPAEMRRTFQFFDRDGGGTIDLNEFTDTLRERCGLVFEDKLIKEVMSMFDPTGVGSLDYTAFSKMVLGSTGASSETSFVNDASTLHQGTDEHGNSEKFLRRRVREQWKILCRAFKQAASDTGDMTPERLRDVLYKHNILISNPDFNALVAKIDVDGDNRISTEEFLGYFGKGQDDEKSLVPIISDMSIVAAKRLIQQKIEGRLKGGPAGLRRAWQLFDSDGSGCVTPANFQRILKEVLGVEFGNSLFSEIVETLFAGCQDMRMNFQTFAANVMDSRPTDGTSAAHGVVGTGDKYGNSPQALRKIIRENWKALHVAFKHAASEDGDMTPDELRGVLNSQNIILPDQQFTELIKTIDEDGDGRLSYLEFLKYFQKGSLEDKDVCGIVKGVSAEQAITMIRDKVRGRLSSGPAEMRRTFQFFDRDGGGTIDLNEFTDTLREACGLVFEDGLLQQVMSSFDPDGSGELDYNQFTQMVFGSSKDDSTSFGGGLNSAKKKSRKTARFQEVPEEIAAIPEDHAYLYKGSAAPSKNSGILRNLEASIAKAETKSRRESLSVMGATGSSFWASQGSDRLALPSIY